MQRKEKFATPKLLAKAERYENRIKKLRARLAKKNLTKDERLDIRDEVAMHKADAKDFRKVAKYLKAGRIRKAERRISKMDTSAIDELMLALPSKANYVLGLLDH